MDVSGFKLRKKYSNLFTYLDGLIGKLDKRSKIAIKCDDIRRMFSFRKKELKTFFFFVIIIYRIERDCYARKDINLKGIW